MMTTPNHGITIVKPWLGAALICVVWSTFCPCAQAQAVLLPGARGPESGAATRPVALYLQYERQLQSAIDARDKSSVLKLLDPSFVARFAGASDFSSKDEWLRRVRQTQTAGLVRELSVQMIDDLAFVSFNLELTKNNGQSRDTASVFVVDLWRISSGRLLTRAYAHRMPGRVQARPIGRE